jgi:hypothetical protein
MSDGCMSEGIQTSGRMTKLFRRWIGVVLWLVAMTMGGRVAYAQGFGGPGMGPGMGGPPAGQAPKKPAPNPNEPQTHAASGASDDTMRLGGTEPTLPQNPLEIPPEVRSQIGTDAERERETGRGPRKYRLVIPPYYSERSGQYSFKTIFPIWVERKQPNDRASLFGMLYYNRRSTKYDADILFPLIWHVRDDKETATIVGPVVHREGPGLHDNWFAPLFFEGSRPKGGGYLHIPPLLTFTSHDHTGGFNVVGLWYCFWKGSSSCSLHDSESVDLGVPPLFFAGKSELTRYEFVPPLLHYYHYNELSDSALNIWGPFIWKHSGETDAFDIFPLFWHSWGKNEDHYTLFPFVHYGYEGTSHLLVTPLFVSARGEKGESTFATWGYARYRGRTTFDLITPLYWRYTDPDIGLWRTMITPLVYLSSSPRGYETGVFPFYFHKKREGLSETTWITPFFRTSHEITGWETDILPILFLGRTYESTHTVVAPFFWDYASPHGRTTIAFPLYWRFADDDSVSQLALNTYYHERRVGSALDWEFHFFPAFSYGETPDGHWWNVLFGLAGYTRRGPVAKVRALWIPFTVSEAPTPPAE